MILRSSRFTVFLALGLLAACSADEGTSDDLTNGGTTTGTPDGMDNPDAAGAGGFSAGTSGDAGGTDGGGGGGDGDATGTGGDGTSSGGTPTGSAGTGGATGSGAATGADDGAELPDIALSPGCAAIPDLASSTVHQVASDEQDDFASALDAAQAGDIILLTQDAPDTYLKIDGYDFDPANPVWVVAQAGVQLHSLTVQYSSGINVAGVEFTSTDGYTLLKVVASQDIKILRNSFDLSAVQGHGQSAIIMSPYDEPTIENSDTIEIGCNSFENIEFATPTDSGSFIKSQYDNGLIPLNLHIHHNLFKNIAPVPNGAGFEGDSDREAIVFGDSDSQDVAANYVVEFNLFEDCDGENEIITVKTSNNTIRHNTFKNSLGSVSVRFGTNTNVYGNYFFADGDNQHAYPNDTGGIRLYGSNHLVFNNYFEGLTGTGYRMPILLDSGDANDSSGGSGHERTSNVSVLNNTIVDCTAGLGVGSENYSIPPSGNTVANNLIVNTESSLLVLSSPINTLLENNMGFGSDAGGALILAESNPLNHDGTLFRLSETSPAVDAGSSNYSELVTDDIEGQSRSTTDIGADEFSGDTTSRAPLASADVGPASPTP